MILRSGLASDKELFQKYNAFKHHWSDNRVPVTLEIGFSGLVQLDPDSGNPRSVYDYKDIEAVVVVSPRKGCNATVLNGDARNGEFHFGRMK